VDSFEFICGLGLLSQSSLRDKAEIIFNLYDFDKTQVITRDEMVILLKTTLTSLNAMCKLPPPTLQEVQLKTDEILQKWDTNKDGSISLQEFQSFVSKDPDILRTLFNYGLITTEDLRLDFGGNDEFPECDSDLENEVQLLENERDERRERIKNGIDHNIKEDDDDEEEDPG